MALGDGDQWDESVPTNSTIAVQIDDYDRDLRKGARSRLALEHEWPASQSATNQAGQHKFVTLQNQATKPTVSGTQLAAVYSKTVGAGLQELFFEDEGGVEVQITSGTSVNTPVGSILQSVHTGTGDAVALTATIPNDNSIPQTGEGTQVFTVAITPGATGNIIEAHAVCYIGNTANGCSIGAMFIGTTADAKSMGCTFQYLANQVGPPAVLNYRTVAGTTGAMTFYVRAGANSGNATLNGYSGTQVGGGVMSSYITVREFKA